MSIVVAALLAVGVILFILIVRTKDLPEPEPVSPFQHLDERKAAIYDNLRDLQFEYRVGKLSDEDYQQTKLDLQRELANVMKEIDTFREQLAKGAAPVVKSQPAAAVAGSPRQYVCPHCKAQFTQALKFCGECGKPMRAART